MVDCTLPLVDWVSDWLIAHYPWSIGNRDWLIAQPSWLMGNKIG
ncbi:hypothetical protein [Oceanobacillus kapialis]|uniref:Uncharacterized protein n=1 Tax=Oceanobacillus kapialis TaxID=481353 RepID=A0ABW5PXR0_9BACI